MIGPAELGSVRLQDRPIRDHGVQLRGRHHGLLGTVIETIVESPTTARAERAERRLIEDVVRLEGVFSVFNEDSELRRWQRGETTPGPELTEVLELSLHWHQRSRGAFNPMAGILGTLWSEAAETGALPDAASLKAAVASIEPLPFDVVNGDAVATGRLDGLTLNAIAKGWIVDRAVGALHASEAVTGVMVNAGGDLLNRRSEPLIVGIEDPRRPFDNVEPLLRVAVPSGVALVTSGGSRRGWRIGDSFHSHLLDPRTGYPVDHVASASVVSTTAAEADVLATILTIASLGAGLELVESVDAACMLVAADGRRFQSAGWRDLALS